MIYSYECNNCNNVIEKDCKMGTAPKSAKCKCGKKADRIYYFTTNIPDPVHEARTGRGKG